MKKIEKINLKEIIIFTLFLSCKLLGFAQITPNNFGFTGSKAPLAANLPVKAGTNIIATSQHVYYVNSFDNKIYDLFWSPTNGWTPATANLGGPNCPAVKTGTNIINNGDEIYFVAASNSKIYQLKWTAGPAGWQYTLLVNGQVAVGGTKMTLQSHSTGIAIYFIGANGKICQLYNSNGSWTGGVQLSWIQSINAIPTTSLIVTDVHVFYVGTNNQICEVFWNNGWTGGNLPLLWTAPNIVMPGTDLVNEFNHLYFVNNTSQICDATWSAATGWQSSILSTTSNVRSGTQIRCYDKNIFYVSSIDNKVWRLYNPTPTTISNSVIQTVDMLGQAITPDLVKINTQLSIWSNDIFEEGYTNRTFKSYHIFYTGNDNKINMLVYDDKHINFNAFGCYDAWDCNNNGTGWDDVNDPQAPAPVPGYDCSLYNVNGIKQKDWYFGKIPMGNTTYNSINNNSIVECNKHFYYVNYADNKICDFLRSPLNGTSKPGYTPAWSDEFNNTAINTNNWNTQFHWGNHNPSACYDIYWNEPSNLIEQNGVLNIQSTNIPSALHSNNIDWLDANCKFTGGAWNPPAKSYNFTTGMITSDNGKHNISEYQYIESRFKIPRGKRFWPGFWFPYGGNEDINFEFDGNGKPLICTMYDVTWNPGIINYAVGYRFYDDYYTYGFKWNSDYISYYVNNELIGSIQNINNHCQHSREIIYTLELSDANIHGACEPEIFPAEFSIDYIRTWSPLIKSAIINNQNQDSNPEIRIFPNPAKNNITIEDESFIKAEIYNIQGEKIFEENSKIINLEGLSDGVYFIKIFDIDGSTNNIKIIKTN